MGNDLQDALGGVFTGMGEAAEQTPIAVVTNVPFVQFQDRVPTAEELHSLNMPIEDDLYAPILACAPWQRGGSGI